ncbi:two component transcriptional regulator, LuxR family [Desulfomicrobium apsheronum]|uniref:Two component transcriptional regulator, LuxR family n=1 Tax=Desulfomicrobium apsheronum TaxID=52560 RepID=A0A1I3YW95_9BACT|nr:response regulator transcription factor [Desulfomicrobium apsheronum]MDY0228219.1 response regulator transcription factor [Desulfomicrobium apsheronum]SFK36118.1 two component transcriptional regulator, LuxR family [Desulfomicrobium apsheronum]
MKKTILLVEDDLLLRKGLKTMIEMRGGFSIEADTGSGKEALRLFGMVHPDIVLLDLRLPDIPGTEVLRQLKQAAPKVPVILLTICEENELLFQALALGANAYVLKGAGPEELFLGIHYSLKNEVFISPKLAKIIVDDYLLVNQHRKSLPPLHNLTAREKQIVRLIIDGKKSKEIADILFISIKTVNKHRSNILVKLGIHNLSELRQRKLYVLDTIIDESQKKKLKN